MTESEIEALAEKLASKLQTRVTDNIYRDAGRNLFSMARNAIWGVIVAIAAWGAAKYGTGAGQ